MLALTAERNEKVTRRSWRGSTAWFPSAGAVSLDTWYRLVKDALLKRKA